MRFYPILLLIMVSHVLVAQYASVRLSEKEIQRVSANSKGASLFVVIDNEKDPSDAALVNAVKNYWKLGTYKFMPKLEYLDLVQKDALSSNSFYLHEFYEVSTGPATNAIIASAQLKNVHTGIYTLDFVLTKEVNPKEKKPSIKKTETIAFGFDVSNSVLVNKGKVLDGYFDLMLKYFANEIRFCQSFVSLKEIKKDEKDGIVYFDNGLTEVLTRDILLIKEQVSRMSAADKKEKKRIVAADAVAQFNEPKNVYTVFPDDIKMALAKSDNKVLILGNGMLLSAKDGAVLAAPNSYKEGAEKRDGFWLAALSVLILAYAGTLITK